MILVGSFHQYILFLLIGLFKHTYFLFLGITGGVGIENMVEKMENNEYMGFANICH